jgi:hypothetical protein
MSKLVITITGWEINVAYKVNNNKDIEHLAVDLIVKFSVNINDHLAVSISRVSNKGA